MKKTLALVLALMMLLSATALADISVSAFSLNPSEATDRFYDSLENDYDFAIEYLPQAGYGDTVNQLTTILASGDSSIDVMLIDEIMYLAFTRAGFLEPLDDVLTEEDMAVFPEAYLEQYSKYNGSIYSVPACTSVQALMVNMEAFNAAGVKVPTNEEEFIEACKALSDPENGKYALAMSLDKASHLQDALNMFCCLYGGNFYEFENEGTQKAIKLLYDLVNTYGALSKESMGADDNAMTEAFLDGNVAMYFGWDPVASFVERGVFGEDKITWMPMPTFETNHTMMGDWVWVVNANSENLEEAKAFVKAQAGYEEQMLLNVPRNGLAGRPDTWEDEAVLNSPAGELAKLMAAYEEAGSLTPRIMSTRHSEYMDVVTGTVQRYLLDEISFDECIELCTQQTAEILAEAAA